MKKKGVFPSLVAFDEIMAFIAGRHIRHLLVLPSYMVEEESG